MLSSRRHVLKSLHAMDLSVFCDCFEEVVCKISVSWQLSFNLPFDGLVLPRGWLSSNENFSSKKDVEVPLTVALLDCVRDVLMHLQTDAASRKQLQASASKPTDSKTFRYIHAVAYKTNTIALQCLYF